jgi:hypothetical protein
MENHLAAAVRVGRALAVAAAQNGVRRRERWEHGSLLGLERRWSHLPDDSDKALGLVDFALHPHLNHERFPENSLANLEKLAATNTGAELRN